MGKPTPQSNRTRIEVNTTNITNLKEDLGEIKLRVTNHIPTAIKAVEDKVDALEIRFAKIVGAGLVVLKVIEHFL